MKEFLSSYVKLRPDGKIDIPKHIKHVKLDIGLAYNAPHSQYWLSHEDNLYVFGFEPNPTSVETIKSGAIKRDPSHGDTLETKYINKNFFIIPCALGLSTETNIKFYETKDCGVCSIFVPNSSNESFKIEKTYDVPFWRLSDFLDLFPFDTHPLIEYIKLDTQGADLDIAKSAGAYLETSVMYITLEGEVDTYKNANNSKQAIDEYMKGIGFLPFKSEDVKDPTYLNSRFLDYARTHTIKIKQFG